MSKAIFGGHMYESDKLILILNNKYLKLKRNYLSVVGPVLVLL
jgi:hypothetical protein